MPDRWQIPVPPFFVNSRESIFLLSFFLSASPFRLDPFSANFLPANSFPVYLHTFRLSLVCSCWPWTRILFHPLDPLSENMRFHKRRSRDETIERVLAWEPGSQRINVRRFQRRHFGGLAANDCTSRIERRFGFYSCFLKTTDRWLSFRRSNDNQISDVWTRRSLNERDNFSMKLERVNVRNAWLLSSWLNLDPVRNRSFQWSVDTVIVLRFGNWQK